MTVRWGLAGPVLAHLLCASTVPLAAAAPTDYLLVSPAVRANLLQFVDRQSTRRCEFQVVGDSISASYLWLNPLLEGGPPDLSYQDPNHCRAFGQHATRFFEVTLTAASGMTADWGVDGWNDPNFPSGLVDLQYPIDYEDFDLGYNSLGPAQAYPELATIMFGSNDLAYYIEGRCGSESACRQIYRDSLETIVQWVVARGVIPLLFTFPPGDGSHPDYQYDWCLPVQPERQEKGCDWIVEGGQTLGERWAAEVKAIGVELSVPVYDLRQAFLDRADWRQLLRDGVHPSDEEGYDLINGAIEASWRALRDILDGVVFADGFESGGLTRWTTP